MHWHIGGMAMWSGALFMLVMATVVFAGAALGDDTGTGASKEISPREAVEKALSDANVRSLAGRTRDAEVLLGLALLCRTDAGREAAALAAESGGDAACAWQLVNVWNGNEIQGDAVAALVQADPSNALAHYLQAVAYFEAGSPLDGLAALKKATLCTRFETYQETCVKAIVRALDALELKELQRLLAATGAGYRTLRNWYALGKLPALVRDKTQSLPEAERELAARHLLAMAGQIDQVAQTNRHAMQAEWLALFNAFMIQQAVATSEKSPRAQAYRKVARLVLQQVPETGQSGDDESFARALDLIFWDPVNVNYLMKMAAGIPPEARQELENVLKAMADAKSRVAELATSDIEEIIEYSLARTAGESPGLIQNVELVAAANELNRQSDLMRKAAVELVPHYASTQRLKHLALGLLMYSNDHKGKFPPDFDTLVEEGYVRDPAVLKGVGGVKYVNIGAEQSLTDSDDPGLVVVYDDTPLGSGECVAMYVDGHVMLTPRERMDKQRQKK